MKTVRNSLLACAALAALASGVRAETPANIVVDWRGLPQVQGVLRDGLSGKAHEPA